MSRVPKEANHAHSLTFFYVNFRQAPLPSILYIICMLSLDTFQLDPQHVRDTTFTLYTV